jgi:hypothetical protein
LWLQVQLLYDLQDPSNGPITPAGQDAQPRPHHCCTLVALLLLLRQVLPDLL